MAGETAVVGSSRVSAQLSARYFRPGGIVRGFVQLATDARVATAATEISAVVAQIHAHVSVDSNLLTVPVVPPSNIDTPSNGLSPSEVVEFAGDSGACLYLSPPCVLLSDINIAPTGSETGDDTLRRCRRDFAIALPETICPTFRGASARVFYVLSVSVSRVGAQRVVIHLPFDVYGTAFSFDPATLAADAQKSTPPPSEGRKDRSASLAAAPVGVRKGNELPFELRPSLMHGRIETELAQRAQTSVFTIGKHDAHLVKLLLTKQYYHPGDVVLGVFDFTDASVPCLEITATLCQDEVLGAMALQPGKVVTSKVVGVFHEYTASAQQTTVRFSVPHNAQPTITTTLVSFKWLLKFEFTASVEGEAAPQVFRWEVPIEIKPPPAREHTSFQHVPHKLFGGPARNSVLS